MIRWTPNPPAALRRTLDAIRYLEDAVTTARGLNGISLRYGGLYGPGTSLSSNGPVVEQARRRRFPVVGTGAGVWSSLHIAHAASATVAALEDAAGVFNVVDDEPAPVGAWLPALAAAVGAKPPRHLPAFLGRLVLPQHLRVIARRPKPTAANRNADAARASMDFAPSDTVRQIKS